MSKQKLTRKSYKRNIIVFGLMLFMGIALVSTGFATWVLSQNTTVEATGNVEVGIVSNEAIVFNNLKVQTRNHTYENRNTVTEFNKWIDVDTASINSEKASYKITGFNFSFEPLKGDNEGSVRYDDQGKHESISLKISGQISSGFQHIQNIKVSLDDNASVKNLIEAANHEYITLPEDLFTNNSNNDVPSYVLKDFTLTELTEESGSYPDKTGYYYIVSEDTTVMYFQVIIEFGWGSKFGGYNPSIAFDEGHKDGEYAEIIKSLQDLRSVIYTGSTGKYNEVESPDTAHLTYNLSIEFITDTTSNENN